MKSEQRQENARRMGERAREIVRMTFEKPRILTDSEQNTIRGKMLVGNATPAEQLLLVGHFDLIEMKMRDALEFVRDDYRIMWNAPLADPECTGLLEMCERHGYGNVIASASRLWRDKDPVGAFCSGPCAATVKKAMRLIDAAIGD